MLIKKEKRKEKEIRCANVKIRYTPSGLVVRGGRYTEHITD